VPLLSSSVFANLMATMRTLPVLMPSAPDQRWSCHSCGDCCRVLVGHLFDVDRKRLDQQDWEKSDGIVPYVRAGRHHVLNKRPDGACVFLTDDNRCLIHSRFGEEAKPFACRVFPFSVRRVGDAWQASFRFDCPSATASKGKPIGLHRADLIELLKRAPVRQHTRPDRVRWRRAVMMPEEISALLGHFVRWFKRADMSLTQRLIGAARLTTTLRTVRIKRVRGPRFDELLGLLFDALPRESAAEVVAPTPRQRAMLRQVAFVHAEHLSLAEIRKGLLARLMKRWQQLNTARRHRIGRGAIPPLPLLGGGAMYEAVEAVEPAAEGEDLIRRLVERYLLARLTGRSVFGAGYYGWPAPDGLAALCLSTAAIGWLARYVAAVRGKNSVSFDAVAAALGVVDRAATRLPALGTASEKTRLCFLDGDDGLARLISAYRLTSDTTEGT